jgi:hypothetical protein
MERTLTLGDGAILWGILGLCALFVEIGDAIELVVK